MLINVTTFTTLGIPLPPPLTGGLTKAEWTWPRFVETVKQLSQAGVPIPFWMSVGSSKDDYHLSNMARTYGVGVIDVNTTCTLTSPRWIRAFNEIVAPLFLPPNNVTPLPWELSTINDIQGMPFIEDPLQFPDLTFSYDDSYNGFGTRNGIWFDTANHVKKERIWNTDRTLEIALALYPGMFAYNRVNPFISTVAIGADPRRHHQATTPGLEELVFSLTGMPHIRMWHGNF